MVDESEVEVAEAIARGGNAASANVRERPDGPGSPQGASEINQRSTSDVLEEGGWVADCSYVYFPEPRGKCLFPISAKHGKCHPKMSKNSRAAVPRENANVGLCACGQKNYGIIPGTRCELRDRAYRAIKA